MVYMYHIFFTHSSADGHLGGFHVLGIVNSTAMIIGVDACTPLTLYTMSMCELLFLPMIGFDNLKDNITLYSSCVHKELKGKVIGP